MNQEKFQLLPVQPSTDSKLTLNSDNQQGALLTISQWRRVFPNNSYLKIQNKSNFYQCTPLDKNCVIQLRFSYHKFGSMINRVIASKPIKVSNELKERMLYVIEPFKCIVMIDDHKLYMDISIQGNKIMLVSGPGKFEIFLNEKTVEADDRINFLKINLQNSRAQFLNFYSRCLKWSPSYRNYSCYCVFNNKLERDVILALVADIYQLPYHPNPIQNLTPRDKSPIVIKDKSKSSLASNNKSRNKDKEKVKISEMLSLKRSINKTAKIKSNPVITHETTVSSNILQSGQYLNIFDEDDQEFLMGTEKNSQLDKSMDLRGSFDELQKKIQSRVDFQKHSNNSFSGKAAVNAGMLSAQQQKVQQENKQLKKKLESLQKNSKQLATIKKKYVASIDEIKRLQAERRAIVMDKVKYESKYRKQLQQKQHLIKELEGFRAKYGPLK